MPAELLTDMAINRYADAAALPAALLARLRAHLQMKLLLLPLLTAAFCIPYFVIGFHPLYQPVTLPLSPLDRAIPFAPQWSFVYESAYSLIPLSCFLAQNRTQIRRYAAAFLLLTALGLAICLFFPVRAPRPIDPATSSLYSAIAASDPPTNAFPSMHMALATQSLLLAAHLLRQAKSRWLRPALAAGIAWLAAIAYATIATRQHYSVDIPAGIALACLCHAFIFRRRA